MTISRYLDERLVVFLNESSRDQAIAALIKSLENTGILYDKDGFHAAILEREAIVSTGIGTGIAIPHAKMNGFDDFFIAIGIQKKRGIEWNTLDGSLVRIIFMIGGPDDQQIEYLKILSRLTQSIRDEERRLRLLSATTGGEVLRLFAGC